jgi:FAD/FMN-containing dehydrogenase
MLWSAWPGAGAMYEDQVLQRCMHDMQTAGPHSFEFCAGQNTRQNTWLDVAIIQQQLGRHPALLVRAADVIGVMNAVRYGREQGLSVAVRSGGHTLAGHGTADGGIVIDLSLMKALSLDPQRRVAWVQPGLTWGEYAQQTQAYGLVTSSGDAATVGVGGLTPGGGVGWMVRKYGLTINHLRSVKLVTPMAACCGQVRTSTPTSSGRCAAAAATSASPRRSSCGWRRRGQSRAAGWSIRLRRPTR